MAALRAWRRTQASERRRVGPRWHDTGLVFTMPDGSGIHPHRLSNWFKLHCRDAGLPRIRLRDVRHTYATIAPSNGVPLKVVSERLGHASTQITADIYSHMLPQTDSRAAGSMGAILYG